MTLTWSLNDSTQAGLRWRRWLALLIVVVAQSVFLVLPSPLQADASVKVAIIVGPVGAELTPIYISLADAAATAAETRGATVARAYSPDASAKRVLAAVEGAAIVVYFGHGVGSPNPYSKARNARTTNGWGLNGPKAHGDHSDSWRDGTLAYYGEAWIAQHARPAAGWVMIYSNTCYAPGASEGFDTPADQMTAAARVAAYSRVPLDDLGASAYFATDFYRGAAHLVGTMLDEPTLPYGDLFASEPNFVADGVTRLPHGLIEGAETWLHRSPYFEGKLDYWYAFAGDPAASLAGGTIPIGPHTLNVGVAAALRSGAVLQIPSSWRLVPNTTALVACVDRCAELQLVVGGGESRAAISPLAYSLLVDGPAREEVLLTLQLPPRSLLLKPPRVASPPSSSGPAATTDVAVPIPSVPPPPALPVASLKPAPTSAGTPGASPTSQPAPVTPTPIPSTSGSAAPSLGQSPTPEPSPTEGPGQTYSAPPSSVPPSAAPGQPYGP